MEGTFIQESQLMNVLRCFGADMEDEKFIVRGGIVSFMGAGQEFVISEDAEYRSGGNWCNLLSAIKTTSYNKPITVF